MIGGAMLLCAVGAMLLIAVWSITRDDAPDSQARDGILALRSYGETKKYKAKNQIEEPLENRDQPRPVQRLKRLRFDSDEMAEIEDEAEQTLPKFLRDAREEY